MATQTGPGGRSAGIPAGAKRFVAGPGKAAAAGLAAAPSVRAPKLARASLVSHGAGRLPPSRQACRALSQRFFAEYGRLEAARLLSAPRATDTRLASDQEIRRHLEAELVMGWVVPVSRRPPPAQAQAVEDDAVEIQWLAVVVGKARGVFIDLAQTHAHGERIDISTEREARDVVGKLLAHPVSAKTLRTMTESVERRAFAATPDQFARLASAALLARTLNLFYHPEGGGGAAEDSSIADKLAAAKARGASAKPNKVVHWVEIVLVDEAGKPGAGVAYELELPNGVKRTGRLDKDGMARFDGIDPGSCKVCFPEIDASEWRVA